MRVFCRLRRAELKLTSSRSRQPRGGGFGHEQVLETKAVRGIRLVQHPGIEKAIDQRQRLVSIKIGQARGVIDREREPLDRACADEVEVLVVKALFQPSAESRDLIIVGIHLQRGSRCVDPTQKCSGDLRNTIAGQDKLISQRHPDRGREIRPIERHEATHVLLVERSQLEHFDVRQQRRCLTKLSPPNSGGILSAGDEDH